MVCTAGCTLCASGAIVAGSQNSFARPASHSLRKPGLREIQASQMPWSLSLHAFLALILLILIAQKGLQRMSKLFLLAFAFSELALQQHLTI